MDKFIEEIPVEGYSVKTDKGFVPILASNKTKEFDVYYLRTENHELRCADEHLVYFSDTQSVYVKDLKVHDKILTDSGLEEILEIHQEDKKEHMFDLSINSEDHRYYTNGILSHNTTMGAFYLLYEACFPKSKGDILIVAHKQGHAVEVLKRMKDMYYSMPLWMKPGMIKNNETSVEFDNGMRVDYCPLPW